MSYEGNQSVSHSNCKCSYTVAQLVTDQTSTQQLVMPSVSKYCHLHS